MAAVKHALKALRKRHLLEEGAHSPAYTALSRPFLSLGSEWKKKAENLEAELQQCYKAQSRMSEQLAVEVAESRASKALVREKDTMISELQNNLNQARDECFQMALLLEEKTKSLELLTGERQELKTQLEATTLRSESAEAENKTLIDRFMSEKIKDEQRLNEAYSLNEDMVVHIRRSNIQLLARQQADGVVRRSEEGAERYVGSKIPLTCRQRISAHKGGFSSLLFERDSDKLVTGGQDNTVKLWDTSTGSLARTLHGCLGSVLDLCTTHDNGSIIAATGSNSLYVWDASSGQVRLTLMGHKDKVCAVDASKASGRNVVSSAHDGTVKVWDLNMGRCLNTFMFYSNCSALCLSADDRTICSGHVDGNVRLWDFQTGRLASEVAAHASGITSLTLSRGGNVILSSSRDGFHNLFDIRSLEICGSLRGNGNGIASSCSRSCLSPDEGYVAAGSSDGSVRIWSVSSAEIVSVLKGHTSPVSCCSWSSGLGKTLATSDQNGSVCLDMIKVWR